MPWLLSTGDDDGTVKVRLEMSQSRRLNSIWKNVSSGTLGKETAYARTLNTLTTSATFSGLMENGSWFLQGV